MPENIFNSFTQVCYPSNGGAPKTIAKGVQNGVLQELCSQPGATTRGWNVGKCLDPAESKAILEEQKTRFSLGNQGQTEKIPGNLQRVCQNAQIQIECQPGKPCQNVHMTSLDEKVIGKYAYSSCDSDTQCPGICGAMLASDINYGNLSQQQKNIAITNHNAFNDYIHNIDKAYWEYGAAHNLQHSVHSQNMASLVGSPGVAANTVTADDVRRHNGEWSIPDQRGAMAGTVAGVGARNALRRSKDVGESEDVSELQDAFGSYEEGDEFGSVFDGGMDAAADAGADATAEAASSVADFAGPAAIVAAAAIGGVIEMQQGIDSAKKMEAAEAARAAQNPLAGQLAKDILPQTSDSIFNTAKNTYSKWIKDGSLEMTTVGDLQARGYPWGFIGNVGDDELMAIGSNNMNTTENTKVDGANILQLERVANKEGLLNLTYGNAAKRISNAMQRYDYIKNNGRNGSQNWSKHYTQYWPSFGYSGTTPDKQMAEAGAEGFLCGVSMGFLDICKSDNAGGSIGNMKLIENGGCLPGFSRVNPHVLKNSITSDGTATEKAALKKDGRQPVFTGATYTNTEYSSICENKNTPEATDYIFSITDGVSAGGSGVCFLSQSSGGVGVGATGDQIDNTKFTKVENSSTNVPSEGFENDCKSNPNSEKCLDQERPICVKNRLGSSNYMQCLTGAALDAAEGKYKDTSNVPPDTCAYKGLSAKQKTYLFDDAITGGCTECPAGTILTNTCMETGGKSISPPGVTSPSKDEINDYTMAQCCVVPEQQPENAQSISALPDWSARNPFPSIPSLDHRSLWVYPLKEPGMCVPSEYGKIVDKKYSNGCSGIATPEQCRYGTSLPLVFDIDKQKIVPKTSVLPGFPGKHSGGPKPNESGALVNSEQPYLAPKRVFLELDSPLTFDQAAELPFNTLITQGNQTGLPTGNARGKVAVSAQEGQKGLIIDLEKPMGENELHQFLAKEESENRKEKAKEYRATAEPGTNEGYDPSTGSYDSNEKMTNAEIEKQFKTGQKNLTLYDYYQQYKKLGIPSKSTPFIKGSITVPKNMPKIKKVTLTPGGDISEGGVSVCKWQEPNQINYTMKLLNCAFTAPGSILNNKNVKSNIKTWTEQNYNGHMWPPIPSAINRSGAPQDVQWAQNFPVSPDPGSCPVFRGHKGAFNYIQNWCQGGGEKWSDACLLPEVWSGTMENYSKITSGNSDKLSDQGNSMDPVFWSDNNNLIAWKSPGGGGGSLLFERMQALQNLTNWWVASCGSNPLQRHCNYSGGQFSGAPGAPFDMRSQSCANMEQSGMTTKSVLNASQTQGNWASPYYLLPGNIANIVPTNSSCQYIRVLSVEPPKFRLASGPLGGIFVQDVNIYDADFVSGTYKKLWTPNNVLKIVVQPQETASGYFSGQWEVAPGQISGNLCPDIFSEELLFGTTIDPSTNKCVRKTPNGTGDPFQYTAKPLNHDEFLKNAQDKGLVTAAPKETSEPASAPEIPASCTDPKHKYQTPVESAALPDGKCGDSGINFLPGLRYEPGPVLILVQEYHYKQSGDNVVSTTSPARAGTFYLTVNNMFEDGEDHDNCTIDSDNKNSKFTPSKTNVNGLLFQKRHNGIEATKLLIAGHGGQEYTVIDFDIAQKTISVAPRLLKDVSMSSSIIILNKQGSFASPLQYKDGNATQDKKNSKILPSERKIDDEVHIKNIPTWYGWDPSYMIQAAKKILSTVGTASGGTWDAAVPESLSDLQKNAYDLVFKVFGQHVQQTTPTFDNFYVNYPNGSEPNYCANTGPLVKADSRINLHNISNNSQHIGGGLMSPTLKMCAWASTLRDRGGESIADSKLLTKEIHSLPSYSSEPGLNLASNYVQMGLENVCSEQISQVCSTITPHTIENQKTVRAALADNPQLQNALGDIGKVNLEATCGCYMPTWIYTQDQNFWKSYGVNPVASNCIGTDRQQQNGFCPQRSCTNAYCRSACTFGQNSDMQGGYCAMPQMSPAGTAHNVLEHCEGNLCLDPESIDLSGAQIQNSTFNLNANSSCAASHGGAAIHGGVPCQYDEDCKLLEKLQVETAAAAAKNTIAVEGAGEKSNRQTAIEPLDPPFKYYCVEDDIPAKGDVPPSTPSTVQKYCRPTVESTIASQTIQKGDGTGTGTSTETFVAAHSVSKESFNARENLEDPMTANTLYRNPCTLATCGKCYGNDNLPTGEGSGSAHEDSATYLQRFKEKHSHQVKKKLADGTVEIVTEWKTIPDGLPSAGHSWGSIYKQISGGKCIPCEITGDCNSEKMPIPSSMPWLAWPVYWNTHLSDGAKGKTNPATGEATCLLKDNYIDSNKQNVGNVRWTHPNPNTHSSVNGGVPVNPSKKTFWLPKRNCMTSNDCCGTSLCIDNTCKPAKYTCDPKAHACVPDPKGKFSRELECEKNCKPWYCDLGDSQAHQGTINYKKGYIFYKPALTNQVINREQINAYYWKLVGKNKNNAYKINYSWARPDLVGTSAKDYTTGNTQYPLYRYDTNSYPGSFKSVTKTGENPRNGQPYFEIIYNGKQRYYLNVLPPYGAKLKEFYVTNSTSVRDNCNENFIEDKRGVIIALIAAAVGVFICICCGGLTKFLVNRKAKAAAKAVTGK